MKKLLSLIMAAALAICLCACGEESPDKAYNNYLKEITKGASTANGTLTVALSPDFAPMEFYDASKKGDAAIVGFDVLLANFLAKELGMKLTLSPMSFEACMAAVQSGKADISISGFSWTMERAENYEITDWYEAGDNETEQVIIVKKSNENKYTKAESFAGMKIAYQGSSLQQQLVKETFGQMSDVDINNVYSDIGAAVEALKSGKVDAVAVAKGNGDAIIANAPNDIAFSGFEFDVDPIYENNVCLIQKGNTALLEKVNAALAKAKEAGYYKVWYEASQIYSSIKTADELGYDENGVKITETAN
ncbi:MAG: transporter substrate-binding domain-containing protein [Lachnospiraceae bacterium]|nr:transporter substrate-binding domain-containing protein [Lachnospiraceae bacterium]